MYVVYCYKVLADTNPVCKSVSTSYGQSNCTKRSQFFFNTNKPGICQCPIEFQYLVISSYGSISADTQLRSNMSILILRISSAWYQVYDDRSWGQTIHRASNPGLTQSLTCNMVTDPPLSGPGPPLDRWEVGKVIGAVGPILCLSQVELWPLVELSGILPSVVPGHLWPDGRCESR